MMNMGETPQNLWLADLWLQYRDRLLRLLALRMPAVLQRRLSVEDLLQETYLACGRRAAYLQAEPEVPMYVKLRRIALQTLTDMERHHLAAAHDAVDVGPQVAHHGEILAGKIGAGIGAEAQIFTAVPVFQIVAGHLGFAAEIGNFVLPVALVCQQLYCLQVHFRLGVVVGQITKIPVFVEGRSLLHAEAVAADMLR